LVLTLLGTGIPDSRIVLLPGIDGKSLYEVKRFCALGTLAVSALLKSGAAKTVIYGLTLSPILRRTKFNQIYLASTAEGLECLPAEASG